MMDRARDRSMFGGILHPQEGYLASRGLRSLPVRMKAHQRNSMRLADYLSEHPKVKTVNYPGLSAHPRHDLAERQCLVSRAS